MEGINMEKSSQGCYKAMQIGFCDSHYNDNDNEWQWKNFIAM